MSQAVIIVTCVLLSSSIWRTARDRSMMEKELQRGPSEEANLPWLWTVEGGKLTGT